MRRKHKAVPESRHEVNSNEETDLGVGADGQRVAGRRRGGELGAHARRGRGQVPDGQRRRLAAHDQRAPVGQQLHGADVVVPLLQVFVGTLVL